MTSGRGQRAAQTATASLRVHLDGDLPAVSDTAADHQNTAVTSIDRDVVAVTKRAADAWMRLIFDRFECQVRTTGHAGRVGHQVDVVDPAAQVQLKVAKERRV